MCISSLGCLLACPTTTGFLSECRTSEFQRDPAQHFLNTNMNDSDEETLAPPPADVDGGFDAFKLYFCNSIFYNFLECAAR